VTETPWQRDGDIADLRDRVAVLEASMSFLRFVLIAVTIVLVVTMTAVLLIALGVNSA